MGPIYVITDAHALPSVAAQVRAVAKGGAWCVQIRNKHASDDQMVDLVALLLPEMASLYQRP